MQTLRPPTSSYTLRLSACTTPGPGRGLTHLLCKRAGPDASGGTPAPATSPSKGRPWLMGDACPQTPTAMLSAGLPQLGGTCGQASPLGVLTTQDRPCPVYQSSEASHPSPAPLPPSGRTETNPALYGHVRVWGGGRRPRWASCHSTHPTPPPRPRLPRQGLAGSLEGGGCPGVAGTGSVQGTADTQVMPSKAPPLPVASGLDSDCSFICLDSPIHAPACPLATWPGRLWRPLAWHGRWLEPEVERRVAAGRGWQWAVGPAPAPRGPRGTTPCSVPLG